MKELCFRYFVTTITDVVKVNIDPYHGRTLCVSLHYGTVSKPMLHTTCHCTALTLSDWILLVLTVLESAGLSPVLVLTVSDSALCWS